MACKMNKQKSESEQNMNLQFNALLQFAHYPHEPLTAR